jgi:p-aminobenzoyl-glutamate transporter AbgT
MIFVYLALVVVLLSWLFSLLGVNVVDPSTEEEVPIESLVSGAGLAYMLTSVVDNFVDFPPLGTVLTINLRDWAGAEGWPRRERHEDDYERAAAAGHLRGGAHRHTW